MSNAVIVKNGQVLAEIDTELKNGTSVSYGYQKVKEEIDANREYNLVNMRTGKISRNKKFLKEYVDHYAVEINEREFFINSYLN